MEACFLRKAMQRQDKDFPLRNGKYRRNGLKGIMKDWSGLLVNNLNVHKELCGLRLWLRA
jgi:hypothetical protein